MAAVQQGVVSASVQVHFDPEHYPKTLEAAIELFSSFGDIARVDMTLTNATGRILVTFFDVRSSQHVLEAFPNAKLFPPAAGDFRTVSIPCTTFGKPNSTFRGFHDFGEIAGASICGQDMVVEYYDMRAAQQLMCTVPGSHPRQPLPLPTPVPPPFGSPPLNAKNNGESVCGRVVAEQLTASCPRPALA